MPGRQGLIKRQLLSLSFIVAYGKTGVLLAFAIRNTANLNAIKMLARRSLHG